MPWRGLHYFRHLRPYFLYAEKRGQPNTTVLNIGALQRVTMYAIQAELIDQVKNMDNWEIFGNVPPNMNALDTPVPWQAIEGILHRYCDAVRDFEYMQQSSRGSHKHNPFVILQSAAIEGEAISGRPGGPPGSPPTLSWQPAGKRVPTIRKFGGPFRTEGWFSFVRLLAAGLGGLALLIPMLIMVLIEGELVNLVVTGIAILTCAVAVSPWSIFGPKDVLTITAAYAGVWVVFVGTQKIGHFVIPI